MIRSSTLTELKLGRLFQEDDSSMVAMLLADPGAEPRVEPPEGFIEITHRYRDFPEDAVYSLRGAWEGTAPSGRWNCVLTFEKALDPKLGVLLGRQDLFDDVLEGRKELFRFTASCAFRAMPID